MASYCNIWRLSVNTLMCHHLHHFTFLFFFLFSSSLTITRDMMMMWRSSFSKKKKKKNAYYLFFYFLTSALLLLCLREEIINATNIQTSESFQFEFAGNRNCGICGVTKLFLGFLDWLRKSRKANKLILEIWRKKKNTYCALTFSMT